MLSRVAQAPRLATATATASASRLSRSAVHPILRAQPLAVAPTWARTYAGSNRKPGQGQNPNPGQNQSSNRRSPQAPPSKSSGPVPRPYKPSQIPRSSSAPIPSSGEAQTSSSNPGASAASSTSQGAPKEADTSAKTAAESQSQDGSSDVSQNKSEPEAPQASEPTPFHKLPDLTQGIPSTLEQEMQEQAGRSQSAMQVASQGDSEGRGARERRETYIPSSERNRRWWTRFMLLTTAVGTGFGVLYMGRNWEDEIDVERHPDAPNGWGPGLWWRRAKLRITESVTYYQEPAFEKLLPDPDPSFERPYTLCLSLDDLLIHSEWTREHGWRIAKRPGMDYFIRYLSQYYELVLFTTQPFAYGEGVVRKLDPFRFIMWPLYREATKFEDGEIVKDLSYLNRDLSKVIILDTNSTHVRKQPENAIILDPWKGDSSDKGLVGLIPFLEYIHTMQYSDVRKVIKSFEGKHIPTEFARREAIARKEFQKQLAAHKHSKPSGVGALGNLLGLKPSNMSMTMAAEGEQNPSEAFAQGKMIQDLARERGQRNYELLEKEIRENGEKWLKEEQQAMEKAQKEAMSSMMGSFSGWFSSPPKPSGETPGK
ncbi:Mitochondrial import inner membrane translocase subunit TIM50 [Hirsutella minnesotensis 3608]|uniref:Mitochondrial import inner membrane translocase subunit TIM50 n=1 Tax=Hirsutella minnesotensis 3608 TaxID=1043627 RepID=A0A0F8A5K1_9HYPO|nr:Mitochondrial import inner membrane translocase subunit TIM50 [Hirsutella minnesotensis 3608]